MVNIKPLDDRVLLQVLDAEQVSAGGIVLPDSAREKPQRGKIKAIGSGKLQKDGSRLKLDVKKGDLVLFGKYAGTDVVVDGNEFKILRENEILGIINE